MLVNFKNQKNRYREKLQAAQTHSKYTDLLLNSEGIVAKNNTLRSYINCLLTYLLTYTFSALTLLAGRQEGHPACKKIERCVAGVVVCLERCADLHMAQLMPLPLTVSCFSKIQISFTFLVPAQPGSPEKRAVKRVCVCYLQVKSRRK